MIKHLTHILVIAVLAGALYAPSLNNEFIWDDDQYVYNNHAVQNPDGLKAIWFSHAMPQYYPVVFTTFWAEHKLWGLDPFGYHLVNLGLHIGNAILLYLVLLHLYPPLALAAGLLFALHPVQVETVAWVTERKNLLACLFYLLAALNYVKFLDEGKRKHYFLSFAAFVLALLSKSIAVSFVVLPPLIKWWRCQKITRADLVALIPFVVVGLVCGINTAYLELYRVGAVGEAWNLSLAEHLILPGQIILSYLWKILYPGELIFFYPKWELDAGQFWQWLPTLGVVALGLALYVGRGKIGRGAFANFLCFICALFPALGIFNVYPMRYSYVADHFQYIASINAIILLAGALLLLLERISPKASRYSGKLIICASLGIISLLYGMQILEHSRSFANQEALWKDVIRKNEKSSIAYNNLGIVYKERGKIDEAVRQFKKAIEVDDENAMAYNNLGLSYSVLGRKSEALAEFEKALQIDKGFASAYNNIGLIYLNSGHPDRAYEYFNIAASIDPSMIEARYNIAEYYLMKRDYGKSVEALLVAAGLQPNNFTVLQRLAHVCELAGQTGIAAAGCQTLAMDPQAAPRHDTRVAPSRQREGDGAAGRRRL